MFFLNGPYGGLQAKQVVGFNPKVTQQTATRYSNEFTRGQHQTGAESDVYDCLIVCGITIPINFEVFVTVYVN